MRYANIPTLAVIPGISPDLSGSTMASIRRKDGEHP